MATTPHADPPKNQTPDDKAKAAPPKAPPAAKAKDAAPTYPILEPESAYGLFYNGHKIAKDGDPPDKWISMGRLGDGTAIHQTPMTPEIEAEIKAGSYYMAEGVDPDAEPPAPVVPTAPPVNVDVPYAKGPSGSPEAVVGQVVDVTMGNWQNKPDSYAYQWKRRDASTVNVISGATSPQYTTVALDGGKVVLCAVSATNVVGATAIDSNDVPVATVAQAAAKK